MLPFQGKTDVAYNPLSVAGLSSTPFDDGGTLSWGYSSACGQTPHLEHLQHLLLSPVLLSRSDGNSLETASFKAGTALKISSQLMTQFLHASLLFFSCVSLRPSPKKPCSFPVTVVNSIGGKTADSNVVSGNVGSNIYFLVLLPSVSSQVCPKLQTSGKGRL